MASAKRLLIGGLVAAGLLLIPVAAAPFAFAGNPCYHGGFEVPDATVAAATDIELQPCAFEPTIAVVQPGATVTFQNGPEVAHLVTGANAAWGDRDVQIDANESVAHTFDEPGIYPYACILHPGMSGAIVVGDGGEPLAAAFAAATAGGGGGSTPQGGAGTGSAATPAASPSTPIEPLAVAAVAALVGAGLALLVIALAARSRRTGRATSGEAEAVATSAEPVTR